MNKHELYDVPTTVMTKLQSPSLPLESDAEHMVTESPTEYRFPDSTLSPASLTQVTSRTGPSTTSWADGNGDQSTVASAIPDSTFCLRLVGQVTMGPSLSETQ